MPPLSHRPPALRRRRPASLTLALAGVLAGAPCAAASAAAPAPLAASTSSSTPSSATDLPLTAAARVSQVYEVDAAGGTWVITVRDDDFVSVVLHEAGTGERDNITPEVRAELLEHRQVDVEERPEPAPTRTAAADDEPAGAEGPGSGPTARAEVGDDPEPAPTRTGPAEDPAQEPAEDEHRAVEESEESAGRSGSRDGAEVPEPGMPVRPGADADVPEVVEELAEIAEDEDGAERVEDGASDANAADESGGRGSAPVLPDDPAFEGAALTEADRARYAQYLAEWEEAKASCDEEAMLAVADEYINPPPRITKEVSEKVVIDTPEEAADAAGTRFTGGGTVDVGKDVVIRDAIFEGPHWHHLSGTYIDVDFDGGGDTSRAWQHDYRGPEVYVLFGETVDTQDGYKVDREKSRVVVRASLIHEPNGDKGSLRGNNTHQDGAQVQAGSFDFQYGVLDFIGNHGGGQGMIFGGDSGDMGPLTIKNNLLRSDRNMLTFQRRGDNFPTEVDFGEVAEGDHNVVSAGPKMGSALSMYINAPTKMTGKDQADITEHDLRTAGECKTLEWENGLKDAGDGGPIPMAEGDLSESGAAAESGTEPAESTAAREEPAEEEAAEEQASSGTSEEPARAESEADAPGEDEEG